MRCNDGTPKNITHYTTKASLLAVRSTGSTDIAYVEGDGLNDGSYRADGSGGWTRYSTATIRSQHSRGPVLEAALAADPNRHGSKTLASIIRAGLGANRFRFVWTYLTGADAGKFDTTPSAPFIEKVTAPLAAQVAPAVLLAGKFNLTPPRHGRRNRPLTIRNSHSAGQSWTSFNVDNDGLLDLWQNEESKRRNSVPVDQAIYAPHRMRETRRRLRQLALGLGGTYILGIYGDSWTGAASSYVQLLTQALQAAYGDAGRGWVAYAFGSTTENDAGSFAGAGAIVDTSENGSNGTLTRSAGWTKSYTAASPDAGAVMSSTPGAYFEWTATATQAPATPSVDLYASSGTIRYQFNGGAWTAIAITPGTVQKFALSSVPSIAWRLRIEVVSGNVILHGHDQKSSTSGVRVHKLGKGGTHSGTWANLVDRTGMVTGCTLLGCHTFSWMLGVNDQWLGDAVQNTPAQYKVNGAEIIDRMREAAPAADILLVTSPEVRVEGYRMKVYSGEWRALARELFCTHMDMSDFFGDYLGQYEFGSTRALLDNSLIHPSVPGRYVLVDAFLQVFQTPTPVKETLL